MLKSRIFQTLLFLAVFFLVQTINADVYMKQKRSTGAMNLMGQTKPAEEVEEEVWMTDKGFRTDNPQNSIIMLFDEKKMYMIDHQKKTYTPVPMDFSKLNAKMMEGQKEEDVQKMQGMMQNMMKMEAKVEVTDETKKINDWNCKKYILTMNMMMGKLTQEIWATEDIEIDQSMYQKFASSAFSAIPGMQNALENVMKEMEKIKGVHVKTTAKQNIMNQNIESTTELISFKKGKAPGDLFKLPSAYKETSMR